MHKGAASAQGAPAFDWDDLRVFLAVARAGSTIAAGRSLGVNQSTVHRRMAELERRIGCRLLERHPTGYRLTDVGRELLPYAQEVEAAVSRLAQRLDESRRNPVGVVRVTCPEPLVYLIEQSPLLDRFRAQHPGLTVEFVMSDRYVDIARGEADIALRSGDTDAGELVGRKIADSVWAVYAARAYAERAAPIASVNDLAQHPLVGFEESMTGHRVSKWLRQAAPDARVVARSNSVLGLLYAVKSGVGVGPLPTALGDADPQLVRVLGPIPELARIWRVLAHPDVRHTPRVAAFFDFICSESETLQGILA
jgi:DNA-binding transcriptional LysR family regulator